MQTIDHKQTDSALLSRSDTSSRLPSTGRHEFPIATGRLYIDGQWRDATGGKTYPVYDPTTEEVKHPEGRPHFGLTIPGGCISQL